MSLLSDIRNFLKRYLKNPILVTAISYIIYRLLQKYLLKENLAESIVVKKKGKVSDIIYDTSTKKYILVKKNGEEIWSADDMSSLESKLE